MKQIVTLLGVVILLGACSLRRQDNGKSDTISLEDWCYDVFSRAEEDTTMTIPDYVSSTDWMKRYGKYITEHFEGRGDMWLSKDTAEGFDCRYWTLAYVDNDTIPELMLYGGCQASGSVILTQYCDVVYASPKGRFSYIKDGDGLLHSQWQHNEDYKGEVYEMKYGKFMELWSYECTINFSDSNEVKKLRGNRQELDSFYYSKGTSIHFTFPKKKREIGEIVKK